MEWGMVMVGLNKWGIGYFSGKLEVFGGNMEEY